MACRSPIASTSKCLIECLPSLSASRARRTISTDHWLVQAAKASAAKVDEVQPVILTARVQRKQLLRARNHCNVFPSNCDARTVESMGSLGSTQTSETAFKPHHTLTEPVEPNALALDHILASTLHLGHSRSFHDRHTTGFIYGRRYGQDIIDARQTLAALKRAAEVVRGIVENDGAVVFMSGLKGTEQAVKNAAGALGLNGFAVTTYKEGFLTDTERVYEGYDFSRLEHPYGRDEKTTAGMLMPALLVMLTPRMHVDAIAEANIVRIPTIGLIDSDTDPRLVTYPIPGNDDSVRGIQLVAGLLGKAGKEGLDRRSARAIGRRRTGQPRITGDQNMGGTSTQTFYSPLNGPVGAHRA